MGNSMSEQPSFGLPALSADEPQALPSRAECGFAKDTCCLFLACCCCTNTSLSLPRKMIWAIIIARGFVCTDGLISGSLVLHWLWLCPVNTDFLLTTFTRCEKVLKHFGCLKWALPVKYYKLAICFIKKNIVHIMPVTLHPPKKMKLKVVLWVHASFAREK